MNDVYLADYMTEKMANQTIMACQPLRNPLRCANTGRLLEGGNFGKTLVGVGEDPTLDESLKARRASDNVLEAAS